jgi:hypothetical protein
METRYQQLVSQMVLDKKLPQYVYKMSPANRFLFDSLINSQIWFSNPQDFNDPFDCDINLKIGNSTQAQMQDYFDNHLKKLFQKNDLQDINTNNITQQQFEILINKAAKRHTQRKGLACFLSSCNNLLAWAHYADSHKGVCLKFDILEDTALFSTTKRVEYRKMYPEYDYLTNKNDFVNQMFFIKSEEWVNEGEVRVLKDKKGYFDFNPKSLKEVVFGCKICDTDKLTLTKVIRTYYPECEIKQAVKNDNRFSLNFIEIL